MAKSGFTEKRVRDYAVPRSGRTYYRDGNTPGLQLCVTSTGSRTYYFRKKVSGVSNRLRLGTVEELTVEQARHAAVALAGDIAHGGDPAADRRAKRETKTFGEVFDWYIEQYAKAHKRTWKVDQQQYDRYVKRHWHTTKVTTIGRKDVQALHTSVGAKHGHYAANRLRALLHKVFAMAIDAGLMEGANPAHGVKKFAEEKRDRFLGADELRRFFVALAKEENATVRDFLLTLLLTAARRANVLTMAWADIDFDREVWRIPNTKTGEPLTVPLSPHSIGLLKRRREEVPRDCPWVFPSRRSGKHLQDPMKPWKQVLKRAGLADVRLHDLRRTTASWQALTGSTLQVIGKSLGHKQTSTTEIYARLMLDPIRESITRATDAMYAAADVKAIEHKGSDDGPSTP
jgi:integrase